LFEIVFKLPSFYSIIPFPISTSWLVKLIVSKSINTIILCRSCLSPTLFNIYFSDITDCLTNQVQKALFADDLGIWCTDSSLKIIETKLQTAINAIEAFSNRWGLILSKKKTFYTVFCTAGLRANYYRTYNLNLRLDGTWLPLDPHPTFLGITLDPKLTFTKHLEILETKMAKKSYLFRRIKGMKINSIRINSILFKSLIRSLSDYAFIPLSSPTQRIMKKLQSLQTRILRQIKYFPLKTRTSAILSYFNLDSLETRTAKLLAKFTKAKRDHDLISSELAIFKEKIHPTENKYRTTFDKMLGLTSGQGNLDTHPTS